MSERVPLTKERCERTGRYFITLGAAYLPIGAVLSMVNRSLFIFSSLSIVFFVIGFSWLSKARRMTE